MDLVIAIPEIHKVSDYLIFKTLRMLRVNVHQILWQSALSYQMKAKN